MYGKNGSVANSPAGLADSTAGGRASQSAAGLPFVWTPWVVLGLVGLYLVWALVEQHEKIQSAVQPHNVAINLRNMLAVTFMVLIGFLITIVTLGKLAALNVPGASGLLKVVGAVA